MNPKEGNTQVNKEYLDELVNVMIHYFIRRNPSKLFKVVKDDDVLSSPQGHGSILPNTSPNLILLFITTSTLPLTRMISSRETVREATLGFCGARANEAFSATSF